MDPPSTAGPPPPAWLRRPPLQSRKRPQSPKAPSHELPPEARRALDRWASLWGCEGLAAHAHVVAGPRLRSSLARCLPERGEIRIAPAVLAGPEALLHEVLCHELAHLAVFERHGRRARPHGAEWRALMRAAGYEPRARMPHEALPEALRAERRGQIARSAWLHRCPVCQVGHVARRPVRRWRCRACLEVGLAGELEITKLAPGSAAARRAAERGAPAGAGARGEGAR